MDGAVEFLVAQLAKRVREGQAQAAAPQRPPPRLGLVPAGARPVPAAPAPPPQAAFGGRRALLGAIVLSEALAPPLGLRTRDPGLGA